MNIIGPAFVEIPVTHDGEGLHGVVRALNTVGYYGTVTWGGVGDPVILYGPKAEHLNQRMPYVALIGDTIRVTDRSADRQQNQNTD